MSYGTMVDTIGEGGHFGEKAAVSDAPRGATIITSKPTELIVLSAEVYRTI
jgi:CRP-like cAMP-binding protein